MTLTQAAFWTKRIFIASIIFLVLGTTAKIGLDIWYQAHLKAAPKIEAKPDFKFGNLPTIRFPASGVSTSNFSYNLDTPDGNLPQEPKLMKVYFIPQGSLTLLSPDKANKLAHVLGFFNGPNMISQTEYQYTDNSGGLLSINLPTGNFDFKRSASSSAQLLVSPTPSPIAQSTIPEDQKSLLISDFRNYLNSKKLLTDDLSKGRSLLTVNNAATFPSQTFAVSIWPIDFDNTPIVTASGKNSLVRAVLTSLTNESDKFIEVKYTHWLIDNTSFATYPLKTPEQAFADLKSGFGLVSIEPDTPQVSIAKVYLAYYQSADYTPYLQPVFVFEGNNFQALVPAISAK